MYITAKEFPFSSPFTHPDSIPVLLLAWHELIWNTTNLHSCWREENTMFKTHVKLTGLLRGQEGNKGPLNVFYHLLPVFWACFLHHQKTRCKAWKAIPSSCPQMCHSLPTVSTSEPSLAAEPADNKWMDPSWIWITAHSLKQAAFCPLVFKTFHVHGTWRHLDR